jgi:alpha-N-acetylglucosaminidase
MRLFNIILTWAFVAAGAAAIRTTASTAGIKSFVQRRLPQHVGSFRFELVDPESESDAETGVEIEPVNDSYNVSGTSDGRILVRGNTVGALFAG